VASIPLSDPAGTTTVFPTVSPVEQQRLKATAASHALLTASHSVHLDPAPNALATPNGDRDAALRYLAERAEQTATTARLPRF
jgi:hypothetical protein